MRLFRLPFAGGSSSLPAWLLRVDLVDVPGLPPPGWSRLLGSTWPTNTPWAWLGWSDAYGRQFPVVFRNASAVATLAALLASRSSPRVRPPPGRPPASRTGARAWRRRARSARRACSGTRGSSSARPTTPGTRPPIELDGAPKKMVRKLRRLVRHDGLRLRPLADQPRNAHARRRTDLLRRTYSCPTLLDPHGSNEPPTRGPTP